MKIKAAIGENILIEPLASDTHETSAGLIISEQLMKGKVIAVSDEYKHIYAKNDTVLYAKEAGIDQFYGKKKCLWLNAKGFPAGHIVAIVE